MGPQLLSPRLVRGYSRKGNHPEIPRRREATTMTARFVAYEQLGDTPNIIVDGAANPHTVLTLSHWPHSGTPAALLRDTSAEIAFAYLDDPGIQVGVDIVSNNHFDEDGLVAVFVLTRPQLAQAHRQLLIDVATAGDFGTYRERVAARIAFTISAYSHASSSPLPREIFALDSAPRTAALYQHMLPLLPALYTRPDEFRRYWYEEDQFLGHSEQLLSQGDITIEEDTNLDLAVIRFPAIMVPTLGQQLAQQNPFGCHSFAIHNHTRCNRLVLIQGGRIQFHYRYESWVQVASRRPLPRVDLAPLATELSSREPGNTRWVFDGVEQITPSLQLAGGGTSALGEEHFLQSLRKHLGEGKPAWNPYGGPPPGT